MSRERDERRETEANYGGFSHSENEQCQLGKKREGGKPFDQDWAENNENSKRIAMVEKKKKSFVKGTSNRRLVLMGGARNLKARHQTKLRATWV